MTLAFIRDERGLDEVVETSLGAAAAFVAAGSSIP